MSFLTAIMTREFPTSETKMMEYENAMKTHLTKLLSLVVMNDAMVPLTVEFMVFFSSYLSLFCFTRSSFRLH